MDYNEVIFRLQPYTVEYADILAALLDELPFESFVYEEPFVKAYMPSSRFDLDLLCAKIASFEAIIQFAVSYEFSKTESRNWNEEWEKNFPPITVAGRCTVKAGFHKDLPLTQYNIVIDPKMAFGTGHHQTTSLMIEGILDTDMASKSVLDMGCGTGILAILSVMRGAAHPVTAIDIDPDATSSANENSLVNGVGDAVFVITGDETFIEKDKYDIILANINRNIILSHMESYSAGLRSAGTLLLSGFYTQDRDTICTRAAEFGLQLLCTQEKENWAMLKLVKS
jgi:ribosomal protein L11 methyltransferase